MKPIKSLLALGLAALLSSNVQAAENLTGGNGFTRRIDLSVNGPFGRSCR